ncbi:hypothetical protein [Mucilaginibacter pocheonensis]|uniref:Uncharacterized protein n=1 Tax=Mucilaginibacter pocheonensis TaxID=398050 RepID=A0ABU1T7M7_9SPHI|nr:hypothetical protein [Mucilaginibacter pocheonensis]MDR6941395.1 hypothetical protein [Mucilaginibacter pocheonensis]
MKTIEQLTNVEKAKIIFDLFKSEIPAFLEYAQAIADKVSNTQEELIPNWNNPFLSYHQWLSLATTVNDTVSRKRNSLVKSANVFAEQLFAGYLAIFSNHCLEQYGLHKAQSAKFARAISLFYLPVQPADNNSNQYLVLEMQGGAEYAGIVTDVDGNNRVFENREDAEAEAADCQDGLVVAI